MAPPEVEFAKKYWSDAAHHETHAALRELRDWVYARKRFLVVTHARPDIDAIASLLGMYLLLRSLGTNNILLFAHGEPDNRVKGLFDMEILDYFALEEHRGAVSRGEAVVVYVDFNDPTADNITFPFKGTEHEGKPLVGGYDPLRKTHSGCPLIMKVDHHSPGRDVVRRPHNPVWVDENRPCASLMIMELLAQLSWGSSRDIFNLGMFNQGLGPLFSAFAIAGAGTDIGVNPRRLRDNEHLVRTMMHPKDENALEFLARIADRDALMALSVEPPCNGAWGTAITSNKESVVRLPVSSSMGGGIVEGRALVTHVGVLEPPDVTGPVPAIVAGGIALNLLPDDVVFDTKDIRVAITLANFKGAETVSCSIRTNDGIDVNGFAGQLLSGLNGGGGGRTRRLDKRGAAGGRMPFEQYLERASGDVEGGLGLAIDDMLEHLEGMSVKA